MAIELKKLEESNKEVVKTCSFTTAFRPKKTGYGRLESHFIIPKSYYAKTEGSSAVKRHSMATCVDYLLPINGR